MKYALLVFFLLPAPEPEVLFAPTGSDRAIEARVTTEIRAARKRVSVAIYQFTSKEIATALCNAKRQGVDVRLLTDGVQAASGTQQPEILALLEAAKVPVRKVYPMGVKNKNAKESEAMRPKFHHKFCVIDSERVLAGSYNWTVLADEKNFENLLVLPNAKIAALYQEQFDKVWKDGTITEE